MMLRPDLLLAILMVSIGLSLVMGTGWPLIGGGGFIFTLGWWL